MSEKQILKKKEWTKLGFAPFPREGGLVAISLKEVKPLKLQFPWLTLIKVVEGMWNAEADKGRVLFLKQKLTVTLIVISLICYIKLPSKKGLRLRYISAMIKLT